MTAYADERGAPRRFAWRPPSLGDLALAAGVAAIQVVGSIGAAHGQSERADLDWLAFVLILAGPLALLVRRGQPLWTLAATVAITLVYLLLEYPYGPVFLCVVVALGTAILAGERIAAWIAAGVLYGGHFAGRALLDLDPAITWGEALGVAAWLSVVLVGSELIRMRRDRVAEARRRRAEEERRRASEERLRIARELHDVLAHNISVINVQAGVALHLMEGRPEQARTALTAIRQASKDALDEVRSVLDVLRRGEEDQPSRAPAPTLGRLEELVGTAEASGLRVVIRSEGRVRPLPAEVELAGFRIVQEALTNAARHAGAGAAAEVVVAYGERELSLRVEDDGRGTPAPGLAPGGGNGIPGMRERAAALGGSLEAGPRAEGGFRVAARLPLPERPGDDRG